jgi:hypothetical protein
VEGPSIPSGPVAGPSNPAKRTQKPCPRSKKTAEPVVLVSNQPAIPPRKLDPKFRGTNVPCSICGKLHAIIV